MPIIPTPDEARKLRVLYQGNPVIDEAEIQLRQRGATGAHSAAALIEVLGGGLTERERQATIARFMTPAELLDEQNTEPGWECTECDCYHPCFERVCPIQCPCHRTCGCSNEGTLR